LSAMRRILFLLLLVLSAPAFAQNYLFHLTVDKISLGSDSVKFPKGKHFVLSTSGASDTLEVGKPGGVPVAMQIKVGRYLVSKKVRYDITYTFFKKENGRWTKIQSYGPVPRYDLLKAPADLEKTGNKKAAREEYSCEWGVPKQFSASFRLDVYRK